MARSPLSSYFDNGLTAEGGENRGNGDSSTLYANTFLSELFQAW